MGKNKVKSKIKSAILRKKRARLRRFRGCSENQGENGRFSRLISGAEKRDFFSVFSGRFSGRFSAEFSEVFSGGFSVESSK